MKETSDLETEAFLAVLNGNRDQLQLIFETMTDSEVYRLMTTARQLGGYATLYRDHKSVFFQESTRPKGGQASLS